MEGFNLSFTAEEIDEKLSKIPDGDFVAKKVEVENTTAAKATSYYPIYVDGMTGERIARCTPRLYLYDTGTAVYFNVGSSNQIGGVTIHHSNGKYANLLAGTPTENRNINLPDADGTLVTVNQMNNAINAAIAGAIGGSY